MTARRRSADGGATRRPSPERPRGRSGGPKPISPIPPLVDPAEAVERIVPRRQLLFEDGDIVIVHQAGALRRPGQRLYQLRIRGAGPVGGSYVNFDHASAAGEDLAARHKVRLFYVDDSADPATPHLLKDYRPHHK